MSMKIVDFVKNKVSFKITNIQANNRKRTIICNFDVFTKPSSVRKEN